MIRQMQMEDIEDVVNIERLVQTHPWSTQQFQDSFATYQLKELLKNKADYPYAVLQLSMMMGHETPEITISNYIHFDFLILNNFLFS